MLTGRDSEEGGHDIFEDTTPEYTTNQEQSQSGLVCSPAEI
jgi:hypothetical protein